MRTSGLLDLQVNGYAGVDFNSTALTADALDHALQRDAAGRRHALPADPDHRPRSRSLPPACTPSIVPSGTSRLGPVMVPGIHLEGPFLNPTQGYAGCHPAAAMVPPDPACWTASWPGIDDARSAC